MSWKSAFAVLALLSPLSVASQEAPPEEPTRDQVSEGPSATVRYLVDTGPLRIRDQFQFGMGFLAFDPVSAVVLERGEWQMDVVSTFSNAWAQSDDVEAFLDLREGRQPFTLSELQDLDAVNEKQDISFIDGELLRSAIAIRRGIGKGVQLELVVPILSYGGGFLDPTIESFHDTFGFGQAGRTGVAKDDFSVYVAGASGSISVDEDPGAQVGDIVVGAKFRLREPADDGRYHLALEVVAEAPTGKSGELTSNGEIDLGAQMLLTRYFDKACLHLSLGILALGEWEEVGIESQILPSLMVAWEQALNHRTTALAQATLSDTPFGDLDIEELSAFSAQITLGLKRVVYGNKVLFVGFTENLINLDSTSDVGFHAGLTVTY